jgi:hypothetical protein
MIFYIKFIKMANWSVVYSSVPGGEGAEHPKAGKKRRKSMNRKLVLLVVALAVAMVAVPVTALAQGQSDLGAVRAATAQFHRAEVALAAGYLQPGLDECVELPGVGGMGYHFVNPGLLFDADLDPLYPEALVYAPGPQGQMRLVAVEYIVPAPFWDANQGLPSVLGQDLLYNPHLDAYALHVWVWKHNPAGMFEDWNPTVSCQ